MPGGQRHHRRLQTRPERGEADQARHPGAGPCEAVPTAQLMCAMLGPPHADRRQLGNLMATEPPPRALLLIGELASAPATRIGVVIDDLINLVLRPRSRPAPGCPGCPPALRRSPSERISSFAFARASARR